MEAFQSKDGTDVVVGTTLAGGEDGLVDAFFEIRRGLKVFPEKDETSSRPTEGLVAFVRKVRKCLEMDVRDSRSCGDNVAVLKGGIVLLCSNEAADVCDVGHEVCTLLVASLLQSGVVPVTGVCRATADDKAGLEYLGLCCESVVVDEVGRRVNSVGKGLEVDGRCGHLLLCGLFHAMSRRTT